MPIVNFNQNVFGGVSPLEVRINTTGTQDPDGDELVYTWTVNSGDGKYKKTFKTQDLSVQLKNRRIEESENCRGSRAVSCEA